MQDWFAYSAIMAVICAACLIFFNIKKTLIVPLILIFCLYEASLHWYCWKIDTGSQAELKNGREPQKGETANGGEKSD